MTTPRSMPAYHARRASKTPLAFEIAVATKAAVPFETTRANICKRCVLGITTAPAHQTKLVRRPLPPQRHCLIPANHATAALQNNSSLQNEGASHNKCGPLTATSLCRHYPLLPHFYPVFTLFLPRPTPSFLPLFCPIFTPLSPHHHF